MLSEKVIKIKKSGTEKGAETEDTLTVEHFKCTGAEKKFVCYIKKGGKKAKAVKVGSKKHKRYSKSDKYIVGKTEYDSKGDAKKEKGKEVKECPVAEKKFVCYIKKGGKKPKAVAVGSKKHKRYSKSNKYIVGKTEYDSKGDAKKEKGKEVKECPVAEKKFVCYIKKGGKKPKAVKVGSRKHTKLSSSDKHIVGKTEYNSKSDAKKEKGTEVKECVPTIDKFVCTIKKGGKKPKKLLKLVLRKHTKLSSSDKHIVGKTEYNSKKDAKEEKGAEVKECVPTTDKFVCVIKKGGKQS